MSIYNSLTKRSESLPILINWYTCGPTVYDYSHLGHARTYIMVDLMRRALEIVGYKITLGMNITDIDDKIINRAKEEKTDVKSISRKYTDLFFKDMLDLNVKLPNKIMNVTDYIPEMIADIQKMISNDLAYIKDGSVHFNKKNYLEKGFKMPGLKCLYEDENETSEGDFALWKGRDQKEDFGWDSPFGFGVPGWHLECTVLSHRMFPSGMNIHSGGIDLAFPHHENEIIQNNILDNDKDSQFIQTFVHIGHLHIDGRKMAKSLRNFKTIREILQKYSSDTIRMYFMLHHYRQQLDYSESGVQLADNIYQYITHFVNRKRDQEIKIERLDNKSKIDEILLKLDNYLIEDFNFPNYIQTLSTIINNIYSGQSQFSQLEIIEFTQYVIDRLKGLGFLLNPGQNIGIIDRINDFRLTYRQLLKENHEITQLKRKMFEASDQFRNNLAAIGVKLEDKKLPQCG